MILISAITLKIQCQEILTIGEVFDFAINDEFHINDIAGMPRAYKMIIKEKNYSTHADTVFYKVHYERYSTEYNPQTNQLDYYFSTSDGNLSYTHLDSSIFTFHYLSKLPEDTTEYVEFDSLIYIDTILCNSQINGFKRKDGDFEPTINQIEFGKGLGKTYDYSEDGSSGNDFPDYQLKLVYFKKDGFECGTPDGRLNVIENSNIKQPQFEVFPTLVDDQITIRTNEHGTKYDIWFYDLTGKIVQKEYNLYGHRSINLSMIPQGMYILFIRSRDATYSIRFIKE